MSARGPITLNVHGMTCPACERRIERKVGRLAGVASVAASHRTGRLTVTAGGRTDLGQIKNAVREAGYQVRAAPVRLFSSDKQVWRDFGVSLAIAAVVVAAFQALNLTRLTGGLSAAGSGEGLALAVLLGVAASLSTCMALVGGLVLGVAGRYAQRHPEAGFMRRMRPQLVFHAGRVLGFGVLGAALGALGGVFRISGAAVAVLTILVALIMLRLGLTMTGIAPGLAARLNVTLPRGPAERWEKAAASSGKAEGVLAFGLGAGTFFLPCGFTQTVQAVALATGSPARAGALLALFALGTMPGLLGVAGAGSADGGRRGARLHRFLGVVVVVFALVNAGTAAARLAPGLFASGPSQAATERSANVADEAGTQVVRTVQDDRGYTPAEAVVFAGEPVRWEITTEARGCASLMNLEALGLGTVELIDKTTAVEFTPAKPGVYQYTCAMGMFRGWFQAIERSP
ncbi:MAG: sulfite exporter TauE/SafE family protein [Bifidobacteriaceae bacterium]|jgi:sulfite exporter TauE/SafE/copper chaperone CopZ|nr:sulfite exporter TauE/SafE family protein [Bifidobacteriaceae bacterium]